MSKPFIYVASPHSHEDKACVQYRHDKVCQYTARLIEHGNLAFSPIAHSHNMAIYLGPNSCCFQFWEQLDSFFLERCDIVHILCIEGWLESDGIKEEVKLAEKFGKPVVYIPWGV